jgi:hypothetical protein
MIKPMIAAREGLLKDHPEPKDKLLMALRASLGNSGAPDEIADAFMRHYGGDKEASLAL